MVDWHNADLGWIEDAAFEGTAVDQMVGVHHFNEVLAYFAWSELDLPCAVVVVGDPRSSVSSVRI